MALSRRQALSGLAAAPAVLVAPSVVIAASGPETAAWDAAMADYLRIKAESDRYDEEVLNPAYAQIKKVQPDYVIRNEGRGRNAIEYYIDIARLDDAAVAAGSLEVYPRRDRPQIDAIKAQHDRYAALADKLRWGPICERSDRYGEMLADAEYRLLRLPAPNGQALTWKLDLLFASCGDSIDCYSIDHVEVFFEDIRRIGGAA